MDWIKVKAEHISPLYSDAQVGVLIRFQLLVALYGRIPTRGELTKLVNSNCLKSLERVMSTLKVGTEYIDSRPVVNPEYIDSRLGVDLEYIGSKVLEDRDCINSKRLVERNKKRKQRGIDKSSLGTVPSCPVTDKIRVEEIIEEREYKKDYIEKNNEEESLFNIWNDFAKSEGLSPIMKLSPKRKAGLKARSKEKEFDLQTVLDKIKESDFLLGQSKKGWKVDFDFIFCSPNNYLKIIEGKYGNKKVSTFKEKWEWADAL